MEDDKDDLSVDLDGEDEEHEGPAGEGIDFRFVDTEDDILATFRGNGVAGPTAASGTRSTASACKACCGT